MESESPLEREEEEPSLWRMPPSTTIPPRIEPKKSSMLDEKSFPQQNPEDGSTKLPFLRKEKPRSFDSPFEKDEGQTTEEIQGGGVAFAPPLQQQQCILSSTPAMTKTTATPLERTLKKENIEPLPSTTNEHPSLLCFRNPAPLVSTTTLDPASQVSTTTVDATLTAFSPEIQPEEESTFAVPFAKDMECIDPPSRFQEEQHSFVKTLVAVAESHDIVEQDVTVSPLSNNGHEPSNLSNKRNWTPSSDEPVVVVAKSPRKDAWMAHFETLQVYKNEHGDCIVPRGYPLNPRLASWVAEQRKQYKLFQDDKPTSMTQERIDLLNTVDFAWNAQEAAWDRHVQDLKDFRDKYGHCHVPLNQDEYPKLGLWVKEQRRHYTLFQQGKSSHMTLERSRELGALGFCWDTQEASWLERLGQLLAYKQAKGDCLVPAGWSENPKLSSWVHHQRRQYKKWIKGQPCHITEARIRTLENMGFCWNARDNNNKIDSDGNV